MAGSRSCSRAAGRSGGWVPRPDYLAVAVLAQAGYLFPWIWIPLVVVLVRGWRRWSERADGSRTALALRGRPSPWPHSPRWPASGPVLPHWGLIGLVSALPDAGPGLGRSARGRVPQPAAAAWPPMPACP